MENSPGRSAGGGGLSVVNEDVMQNILARLPALSFASAACVNKSWNCVANRILSRPKLASALSLNSSLHVAVKEVLDKVLSEPIRPHFAIACIGSEFNLEEAHQLITEKLGRGTPIVTNSACGIIGVDGPTNELREVKWEYMPDENDPHCQEYNWFSNVNRGIVLVVGYLPGLRVCAIPLLRSKKGTQEAMVDKFVMDIMDYSESVSGYTSPANIIMFGDRLIDMKPVLAKMDCAMPEETIIVGDPKGCFLFGNGDDSLNGWGDLYFFDAVALVFAEDKEKSPGIGEIEFHLKLSTGVVPFGPQLNAVSVTENNSEFSWLSARVEGHDGILDGQGLLDDINDMMDHAEVRDLYIGVTQQREFSIGSENLGSATSLTFYEVIGGENDYIVVAGVGIKPGDAFLFYHSDSITATTSSDNIHEEFEDLKADSNCTTLGHVGDQSDQTQVFGGFIFSCYSLGGTYFGCPNLNTAPFSLNFPSVPLAGVFCGEAIGRDSSYLSSEGEEEDEEDPSFGRCCLHVYSNVYLAMSYVPALPVAEHCVSHMIL